MFELVTKPGAFKSSQPDLLGGAGSQDAGGYSDRDRASSKGDGGSSVGDGVWGGEGDRDGVWMNRDEENRSRAWSEVSSNGSQGPGGGTGRGGQARRGGKGGGGGRMQLRHTSATSMYFTMLPADGVLSTSPDVRYSRAEVCDSPSKGRPTGVDAGTAHAAVSAAHQGIVFKSAPRPTTGSTEDESSSDSTSAHQEDDSSTQAGTASKTGSTVPPHLQALDRQDSMLSLADETPVVSEVDGRMDEVMAKLNRLPWLRSTVAGFREKQGQRPGQSGARRVLTVDRMKHVPLPLAERSFATQQLVCTRSIKGPNDQLLRLPETQQVEYVPASVDLWNIHTFTT